MKKIIFSFIGCIIFQSVQCAQAPLPTAHTSPAPVIRWFMYLGESRQPYTSDYSYETPTDEVAKKKSSDLALFKATSNLYELISVTEEAVPIPYKTHTEKYTFFSVNFKQGPLKYLSVGTARNLIFLTAKQEKLFEEQLSSMKETQTVEPFVFSVRH